MFHSADKEKPGTDFKRYYVEKIACNLNSTTETRLLLGSDFV